MRKTALVVDDSPSLRQMVAMTLKTAGFDVVEATDGEDALMKLKGRVIDLFVCDVHMPKLNGLEFTRKIRALSEHRRTPVLILTTDNRSDQKEAGRAVGATAWLIKPFNPPKLVEAVQMLCPA